MPDCINLHKSNLSSNKLIILGAPETSSDTEENNIEDSTSNRLIAYNKGSNDKLIILGCLKESDTEDLIYSHYSQEK